MMSISLRKPSILLLLLIGSVVSTSAFAQSAHGVFMVVKGEVSVESKSGGTTKAKIGQKVFPSDKITAGKDSRAKVVMVDKNEINISPDSQIVIENYQYKPEENKKNVLINVLYGKVRAKVEQKYDEGSNKFQIKTPTAVAGVRGTDFITGYDSANKTSQVVTFRGKVEFGLPGKDGAILNPVFVTPGQQTSMAGSNPPPPPTAVPKAELQKMDKSSDAEKAPAGPAAGSDEKSGNDKKSDKKDEKKSEVKDKDPAKDGAKSDDKKGASNNDSKGNGPAAGPAPKDGGIARDTASNGPATPMAPPPTSGGMMRPEDMPGTGSVAPPMPVVIAPTMNPMTNIPKVISGVNDAIEVKNRTLQINVAK